MSKGIRDTVRELLKSGPLPEGIVIERSGNPAKPTKQALYQLWSAGELKRDGKPGTFVYELNEDHIPIRAVGKNKPNKKTKAGKKPKAAKSKATRAPKRASTVKTKASDFLPVITKDRRLVILHGAQRTVYSVEETNAIADLVLNQFVAE